MKIELKRISHNARLSEETYAFTADVWIDGVKAGEVQNAGHGGPDQWHPREVEARIDAYAATLPHTDVSDMYSDGQKHTMEQSAEVLIANLVTAWLHEKEVKRALSKRILYTIAGKDGIYQTKAIPAAQLKTLLASPETTTAKLKAEKVLNLLPVPEAVALYIASAA